MILKMPFLNKGPGGIVILHLARRVPSEMKIMKIDRAVVLGRPGGMRGGAGRRYEEGLRYTKDFGSWFDTPALLYETGGGFNRYAHFAGPKNHQEGFRPWDHSRIFFRAIPHRTH